MSHSRITRMSALGAGLISSVLLLSGCSAPAEEAAPATQADIGECSPDGVTITAQYANQGQAAAELGKKSMEETYPGLTVDLKAAPEGTSYDELTQQIVADIAAGSRPDVIMLGLDQLRFWVEKYSPREIDRSSPPASRSVLVGVRPERLRLREAADYRATGLVHTVIFEGETQVLEITVDGVPAAVRTDRGVSVHRGESVSIGFNASDILLFDAETGARLPRDGAHAE